jgi:hypothetical protein
MAQTTPAASAGGPRAAWSASLVHEAPYLLLIVLGLIGISWTSLSRTPPTTYWVVLTPVAALICIAAGWRHSASGARLRMVASQVLHWAAVLVTMYLITISDSRGTLSADATGLMLLTLLALGVFTAGLNLWSWKLCATGAFLGVAAPVLAWVEQAALLIMLILGLVLIGGGFLAWRFRGDGGAA